MEDAQQTLELFTGRFKEILDEVLPLDHQWDSNDPLLMGVEEHLTAIWETKDEPNVEKTNSWKVFAEVEFSRILTKAKTVLSEERWQQMPVHLARKRVDYGHANITKFGAFGIVIRSWDKCARLRNLYARDGFTAVGESVEDAWVDIAGYAAVATLVIRGEWAN